ncbi:MAG: TerB family tellurite resistance protein [Alphaproteobacteria bacterium]
MTEAQKSDITAVSDSTFHLWRCIIALAKADGIIEDSEITHINSALASLKGLSAEQRLTLGEDMVMEETDIAPLLARVTDKADRALIFHFGGLLAESDGELEPGEEAILQRLAVAGNLPTAHVKKYFSETRAVLEQKKAAAELKALAEATPKVSPLRLMVRYLLKRLSA